MPRPPHLLISTGTLFAALSIGPLANAEMPGTLNWTAYGTGTSGHAQIMAIGQIIQSRSGTQFRVIPGANDILRMTPLKTGRVDLCACGIASYYGSEGVMMFAGPDWGPQPIRVISTSVASFGLGMAVAGDVAVETPADLEGKRVAYIRGDDALNKAAEAYLAFGGLTWEDVEQVVFPGYDSAFDGIISGRADAAITTTVTPAAQRLEASPRGIRWPELSLDNSAGWARMEAVAPYFQPHKVISGAGISAEKPYQSASYPYPIMVANADLDYDTAYGLIETLVEDYERYKDAAPGAAGYAVDNQNMTWVVPFHEAVVDYYREAGLWTNESQAHQQRLLQRQRLLAETWDDYVATAPDEEEAFREGWLTARAQALEAAGLPTVF